MKKMLLVLIFLLCLNIVNASVVVMDADSGRILYSKEKDEFRKRTSKIGIMGSNGDTCGGGILCLKQ